MKARRNSIVIIASGILACLLGLFCLVPAKEVPYIETVQYDDVETYYESEIYVNHQTYPVAQSISLADMVKWKGEAGNYEARFNLDLTSKVDSKVQGSFGVTMPIKEGFASFTIRNPEGVRVVDCVIRNETATRNWEFLPDSSGTYTLSMVASVWVPELYEKRLPIQVTGRWTYQEIVSEDVTRTRMIPKQRPITRERQETRYRKVTWLEYISRGARS